MHELVFQNAPEAFNRCVIVTVASTAHRGSHFELNKERAELLRAILAAAVGMMNQTSSGSFGRNSAEQRLGDEILRHTVSHGVAHDFSGVEILMAGKVQPTFRRGDIGYIGHPDLVRGVRGKILVQQILSNRHRVIRVRRCLELLDLLAAQAQLSAYSLDPMNTNMNVVISQILLQALRAVGCFGSSMSRNDFEFEPFFFFLPRRFWPFQPGVKATR